MEGLWVIDVYQEWCGPCQALKGNFRRVKNELGDSLLQFAMAKADTIDALEQYRGRCEPTFLFYAGGILVSFVHGANAPKVLRMITEQLAHEHKVVEGQAERKEVKDTVMTRSQEQALQDAEDDENNKEQEVPKGCTVTIIKPDAVAAGKTDEIIKELQDKGIEVVAQETRELTDEEARSLYGDLEDEEYYEDLIKFMISGPSHVLVLTSGKTGHTVINDVRGLLGPKNVEEAKEAAPESLRAKYGDNGYMNALHASSSEDMAAKEMAFFFPTLAVPTYMKKKENIQRTLALIRPEAFASSKDEIIAKIHEAGFTIALSKEVQLSKEQAQEFYREHEGQPYFEQLSEAMSSGPVLALGLARDEAISGWREMLGPQNVDEAQEQAPDSMRAKFVAQSGVNQFHGSDDEEKAKREIEFFFPMQETVAVIKPGAMGTKDEIIDKIHEAGFRIAARKETTITKEIVELMYPNQTEKEYYGDLVDSMTSGSTMFMVLTREGAVDGWRSFIGDVNPEEAKAKDPNSLRAIFGESTLNNAVHGSSSHDEAKQTMKAIFGDLKFNPDGTVKGEEPQLDQATVDETTMETTTAEDTTNITANDTADMTAEVTAGDTTVADTTMADTTVAEGDETAGDTTVADTTVAEGDETAGDTTVADTTVAEGETTEGEAAATDAAPETEAEATTDGAETAEPTAEPTADTTEEATAEETPADQTAAAAETPAASQLQDQQLTTQTYQDIKFQDNRKAEDNSCVFNKDNDAQILLQCLTLTCSNCDISLMFN